MPVEPLAGKVVLDTNNHYPQRDGQIAELDAESTTSSELLQRHLPNAFVVKAFNAIAAPHLAVDGRPRDDEHRRALPIAGDDRDAKDLVTSLIDEIEYGVVDAGPLAEGWRFQPGTCSPATSHGPSGGATPPRRTSRRSSAAPGCLRPLSRVGPFGPTRLSSGSAGSREVGVLACRQRPPKQTVFRRSVRAAAREEGMPSLRCSTTFTLIWPSLLRSHTERRSVRRWSTASDDGDRRSWGCDMRTVLQPSFPPTPRWHLPTRSGPAAVAAAALILALPAGTATAAPVLAGTRVAPVSADGGSSAISNWNAIAATTLSADTSKQGVEDFLYMGFVHAAVYDAVVGVDGRYAPYRFRARAPHGASDEAAAVAAAHEILVTYVQSAQAALDVDYAKSLAQIPDGAAKTRGVAFGIRAADHLIRLRANDGRNANIQFTRAPAPGVWRPTPPPDLPMSAPWMGFVTPLLVRSPLQFGPPPPPALTSARYTRDFNEVKALGSSTSTVRTPAQTDTAKFFSGSSFLQYNYGLRDQVAVRHLDIVDAARMFAAVDMSVADALISVWRAKYDYGFWRPITAINLADSDGNPATVADPTWTPLLTTPPYPDYPSGYNSVNSTVTHGLEDLFATRHVQLTLISTAVPGVTRFYDSGPALRREVVDARVWLGIHFRFADTASRELGRRLTAWTLDHYFQPVHKHKVR